jgi:ATP-dependent RNA helicase DeaD
MAKDDASGEDRGRDRRSTEPPSADDRGEAEDGTPRTTLYLNIGKKDDVRTADVRGLLTDRCALGRSQIGRIRVRDKHSLVDVSEDCAASVIAALHGQLHGDRELIVEPAKAK